MKRFIPLLIIGVVLICLFGCAVNTEEPEATKAQATPETVTEAPAPEETAVPENTPEIATEPATEPTAEPADETPKKKEINVVYMKDVEVDYSEGGAVGNPAAIVDEDETTRWSGFDLGRPGWSTNFRHEITIDLMGRYELHDFYIVWETLTGFYKILVTEDGENWTAVYEYDDCFTNATPLTDDGVFEKDTFATMIRIETDVPEGESISGYPYCSIYEFECYGCSAELSEG